MSLRGDNVPSIDPFPVSLSLAIKCLYIVRAGIGYVVNLYIYVYIHRCTWICNLVVTRRRSPEIESEIRRWSQKPRIGDKSRETSLKNSVSQFFSVIVMDVHFLFSFRLKYFHLTGGKNCVEKKRKKKNFFFDITSVYGFIYVHHFVVGVEESIVTLACCITGCFHACCLWLFTFINYPWLAE